MNSKTINFPYGKILREFVNADRERYLTTQHERDAETGLDYRGARYYDAEIARFLSLDPLAAQFVAWSPYNYTMNNPIILVDLDGKAPTPPKKVHYYNMVKQSDGSYKEVYSHSSVNLTIKSADAQARNSVSGVESAIEQGQYGNPGITTNVYSYWNSDETIKSQLVVNKNLNAKKSKTSVSKNDSEIGNGILAGGAATGLIETGVDVTIQSGKTLNVNQLSKGNLVFNNIYRSNGAVNASKYFNPNRVLSTRTALKYVVPGVNVMSLSFDAYLSVKYDDPRYMYRGVLATGASYIPFVGTFVSLWSATQPVESFHTTEGDASIMPDGKSSYGTSGTTCFVAGTKILLANNQEKLIEDILPGDLILSVNIESLTIEIDTVVAIPSYLNHYSVFEAEFKNGVRCEFSPEHPFWVIGKGWSVANLEKGSEELGFSVSQLEIGDTVYYYDDGYLVQTEIISLINNGEVVEMYNLEYVAKNHTFFANGILVHNKYIGPLPKLKK